MAYSILSIPLCICISKTTMQILFNQIILIQTYQISAKRLKWLVVDVKSIPTRSRTWVQSAGNSCATPAPLGFINSLTPFIFLFILICIINLNHFQNCMSLQATLILMDNSAFGINGDYQPTRWESEVDCASLLIQAKLQANQQSSVGVGLIGGSQVQILCTLTSDSIKANSFLFGVKCSGQLHFTQAIQIGALSLKHRSNDTQKQRMICFIGSTITEDVETLKILAKKLKKSGVAVDIICFGDTTQEQVNKVQTFVATIQQQDGSHCVVVQPGENLSDKVIGSPIIGGQAANVGGMNNIEEEDPELAAAIRMSLEQSQRAAPPAPAQVVQPQPQISQPQPSQQSQPQANNPHEPTQEQLQQLAIQMSLEQFNLQQKNQKGQQKKEEDKQKKQ